MPLGRFLEISIATADVAASLAFYESLGFVQAAVGEALSYPYAVVTDGRVCLGLHQREQPGGTTLTWVLPNLAGELDRLEALGIRLEHTRIDDTSLNSTGFVDPSGQAVTLLEARTFSPLALAESQPHALGYFEEFAIPTSDLRASAAFWEPLGFVAFEPVVEPFHKIVVMGRDLNLGLYDLGLRGPTLVFSDAGMAVRVEQLRDRGYTFANRLPHALTGSDAALLLTPDGTEILLLVALQDPDPPDAAGLVIEETPAD